MASTSRKSNGSNGRSHGTPFDTSALRTRAEQMSLSIAGIARVVDEVAEGATAQSRTLDSAIGDISELLTSLGHTAGQAESAKVSSEGLVSSVNEIAASIEQVSAN